MLFLLGKKNFFAYNVFLLKSRKKVKTGRFAVLFSSKLTEKQGYSTKYLLLEIRHSIFDPIKSGISNVF